MSEYADNASGKLPQDMLAVKDGTVERVLIMLLIFAVSLFGMCSLSRTREVLRTQPN